MKFNVNIEASDEEIRALAADAARRGLVYGLQYVGQYFGEGVEQVFGGISPQVSSQIASILQQVLMAAQQRPRTGPGPADIRRPWTAGVKFYPSEQQPPPPGYGGPFGPPPGASYGAPPSAGARVVPLGGTGPMVQECFLIEETSRNEASWGCCRCASPNGLQRAECRTCGHKRCGAVVTPVPTVGAPLQVPGATGVAYPPNGPPPFSPPTADQPV